MQLDLRASRLDRQLMRSATALERADPAGLTTASLLASIARFGHSRIPAVEGQKRRRRDQNMDLGRVAAQFLRSAERWCPPALPHAEQGHAMASSMGRRSGAQDPKRSSSESSKPLDGACSWSHCCSSFQPFTLASLPPEQQIQDSAAELVASGAGHRVRLDETTSALADATVSQLLYRDEAAANLSNANLAPTITISPYSIIVRALDPTSSTVAPADASPVSSTDQHVDGHVPTTAVSSEPTYCTCNQMAFGKMIACDNPQCPIGTSQR